MDLVEIGIEGRNAGTVAIQDRREDDQRRRRHERTDQNLLEPIEDPQQDPDHCEQTPIRNGSAGADPCSPDVGGRHPPGDGWVAIPPLSATACARCACCGTNPTMLRTCAGRCYARHFWTDARESASWLGPPLLRHSAHGAGRVAKSRSWRFNARPHLGAA